MGIGLAVQRDRLRHGQDRAARRHNVVAVGILPGHGILCGGQHLDGVGRVVQRGDGELAAIRQVAHLAVFVGVGVDSRPFDRKAGQGQVGITHKIAFRAICVEVQADVLCVGRRPEGILAARDRRVQLDSGQTQRVVRQAVEPVGRLLAGDAAAQCGQQVAARIVRLQIRQGVEHLAVFRLGARAAVGLAFVDDAQCLAFVDFLLQNILQGFQRIGLVRAVACDALPVGGGFSHLVIVGLVGKEIAGDVVAVGGVCTDRQAQLLTLQKFGLARRFGRQAAAAHGGRRRTGADVLLVAERAVRAVKAVVRRVLLVGDDIEPHRVVLVLLQIDGRLLGRDARPVLRRLPAAVGVLDLHVQRVAAEVVVLDGRPADKVGQLVGVILAGVAVDAADLFRRGQAALDGILFNGRHADLLILRRFAADVQADIRILPALAAAVDVVVDTEAQGIAACIRVKRHVIRGQIDVVLEADALLPAAVQQAVQFDRIVVPGVVDVLAVQLRPREGVVQLVVGGVDVPAGGRFQRRGLQQDDAGALHADLPLAHAGVGFLDFLAIDALRHIEGRQVGAVVAGAVGSAHDLQAVVPRHGLVRAVGLNGGGHGGFVCCPPAVNGADTALDRRGDDLQLSVVAAEGLLRQVAEGHACVGGADAGLQCGQRDILPGQACAAHRLAAADIFADEHDTVDGVGVLHLIAAVAVRCVAQRQVDRQLLRALAGDLRCADRQIAAGGKAGVPLVVAHLRERAGDGDLLAVLLRPHIGCVGGARHSRGRQGRRPVKAVIDNGALLALVQLVGIVRAAQLEGHLPLVARNLVVLVRVRQYDALDIAVSGGGVAFQMHLELRLRQRDGKGLLGGILRCARARVVDGCDAHDKAARPAVAVGVVLKRIVRLVDGGCVQRLGVCRHCAVFVAGVDFEPVVHGGAVVWVVHRVVVRRVPADGIAAIDRAGAGGLLTAQDGDGVFVDLVRHVGIQNVLIVILDDLIGDVGIVNAADLAALVEEQQKGAAQLYVAGIPTRVSVDVAAGLCIAPLIFRADGNVGVIVPDVPDIIVRAFAFAVQRGQEGKVGVQAAVVVHVGVDAHIQAVAAALDDLRRFVVGALDRFAAAPVALIGVRVVQRTVVDTVEARTRTVHDDIVVVRALDIFYAAIAVEVEGQRVIFFAGHLRNQRKAVVQGGGGVAGAAAAAVAHDADDIALAGHIDAVVAAALDVDGDVGDRLVRRRPRTQIAEDARRHRLGVDDRLAAVDAVKDVDGHGVFGVAGGHLHLAEDAAAVVRARRGAGAFHRAVVLAVQDVDRRVGNGRVKIGRNAAHRAAVVAPVVHIRQQIAEIEAVLDRAAVVCPVRNDAADVVGAAVVDTAVVDAAGQLPLVVAVVILMADDAADMYLGAGLGRLVRRVVIVRPRRADKPAHGGAVDDGGQIFAGGVRADNAADGGIKGDVVAVDEPAAGRALGDRALGGVVARDAAQIAAAALGAVFIDVAAAQHDQQVVGAAPRIGVNAAVAVAGLRDGVLALQTVVGAAGVLRQLGHHGVNALVGIGGAEPCVHLLDELLCIFAAAARDGAAVGACDTAHKTVPRRDHAAAAHIGGDVAVFDQGVVAPGNAARVGGVVQLLHSGVDGLDIIRAAHLQGDGSDLAAGDRLVVDARNAADRVADRRCARRDVAARDRRRAQRALIGTLNQSTVVSTGDAAQILIAIQIVRDVEGDARRLDAACVIADRTAHIDEICVDGQLVEVECIWVYGAAGNFAAAAPGQTAHRGGGAFQGDARVLGQGQPLDDAGIVIVGHGRADAVRREADGAVFQCAAVDRARVRRGHSARRAVGRRDGDAVRDDAVLDAGILGVAARHAARFAVCGVDLARRVAANRNHAARRVPACDAAGQFVVGAHGGVVFDVCNFAAVRARCAACVQRRCDAARRVAAGDRADLIAVQRDIAARNAARALAGGDGVVDLCIAQRDGARVDTCHAACVGVGIDRGRRGGVGGEGDRRTREVRARDAADILAAAHRAAVDGRRVLNQVRVDARHTAKVAVAGLLAAEGSVHFAQIDRAAVPAGQAACGAAVGDRAVVFAVRQAGVGGRLADDAARQIAHRIAEVELPGGQRAETHTGGQFALAAHVQAAHRQRIAAAAVDSVDDIQRCIVIVIAHNAADVGVGVEVEGIREVVECELNARFRFRLVAGAQDVFAVKRRQQLRRVGVRIDARQQTVIADDAACNAVRRDAASRDRRPQNVARDGEIAHRQVCADDTADKVDALDAGGRNGGCRQLRGAVHAHKAADGVTRRDDLAAQGQRRAAVVRDHGLGVVVACQTADKAVAVQNCAEGRRAVRVPDNRAVFAVVADHAADVIGVGGLTVRAVTAQILQQLDTAAVGAVVAGHGVRAVLQRGRLRRCGAGRAPRCVVYAGDTAHIGRVRAQPGHKAAVRHGSQGAAAAVDRHDAAHIAAAKDCARVRAVLGMQGTARKAAGQTANEPLAQDIALGGGALLHRDIFAEADQSADEIALEGAGVVQAAVAVVARAHLRLECIFRQIAAAGAGAVDKRHIAAVPGDAAEELPQHTAPGLA